MYFSCQVSTLKQFHDFPHSSSLLGSLHLKQAVLLAKLLLKHFEQIQSPGSWSRLSPSALGARQFVQVFPLPLLLVRHRWHLQFLHSLYFFAALGALHLKQAVLLAKLLLKHFEQIQSPGSWSRLSPSALGARQFVQVFPLPLLLVRHRWHLQFLHSLYFGIF